jgi:hypothetical protein
VVLEYTQSLIEMGTRNLSGCKMRSACKADNLTAIYEPSAWEMWELRLLTIIDPPGPVTGIAFKLGPFKCLKILSRISRCLRMCYGVIDLSYDKILNNLEHLTYLGPLHCAENNFRNFYCQSF